jgi:hypothetical protein
MNAPTPPPPRITQAGQVKGDGSDKKGHPGPPGWRLGLGLTMLPREKNVYSENLRDDSDGIDKLTTNWL